MVRGTNTKGLVLLLVVFLATGAESAPTLNMPGGINGTCGSGAQFTQNAARTANSHVITGLSEPQLFAFQGEFHRQSVSCSSASFQSNSIKSLPPTPRAFVLVLIGFLWVTAVKDRKFWITSIVTILCAGQAGFARLPLLATQLSNRGLGRQCFSHLFCLHGPKIVERSPDSSFKGLLESLEQLNLPVFTGGFGRKQRPACISTSTVLCDNGKSWNAERKTNKIGIAGLVRPCCFDSVNFRYIQNAGRFFFLSCHNVNSRLARGPPRYKNA